MRRRLGTSCSFWTCLEPSRTSFADVARVPPAHTLTVSSRGSRLSRDRTLQPEASLRLRTPAEYVERYVSTLETVVGDRVRSGPAGILISGGLDSSSVAAAAASVVGPASTPTALRAWRGVQHGRTGSGTTLFDASSHSPRDAHRALRDGWISLVRAMERVAIAARAVGGADDGDDGRSARAGLRDTVGSCSRVTVAIRRSCHQLSSTSLDGYRSARWFATSGTSAWQARALPPIGARSAVRQWWSPPPSIVPVWLSGSFRRRFDPDARVRDIDRRREPAEGPRGAALSAMVDPWWTAMFEAHDPGATQRPVELRYPLFDVRFLTLRVVAANPPLVREQDHCAHRRCAALPDEIRTRPKSPLAADVVAVHGPWTLPQAVAAIEAVPELARFVDIRKFRALVREKGLLTENEPGTLAAVALATWLRCAICRRAERHERGAAGLCLSRVRAHPRVRCTHSRFASGHRRCPRRRVDLDSRDARTTGLDRWLASGT